MKRVQEEFVRYRLPKEDTAAKLRTDLVQAYRSNLEIRRQTKDVSGTTAPG